MKKKQLYVILFFLILFSGACSCRQRKEQKKEMIKTALVWGGLYSIPVAIDSINAITKGSMFTREFIIEFTCKTDDIKQWISKSKRLQNNTPIEINSYTLKYDIDPGEDGSSGGYVLINYKTGKVTIAVSWS